MIQDKHVLVCQIASRTDIILDGEVIVVIAGNRLKPPRWFSRIMQIGGFLIPFTKPASPVVWVRPYQGLTFDSKDGKVIVKTSSEGTSIESIFRILKIAAGVLLLVIPLILGSQVLATTLSSDASDDPCNFFGSGEYIEFEDVEIMCFENKDVWSLDSFETADDHFRYRTEWGGFEEYRWSQSGNVVTLCQVDSTYDEYYCNNMIRGQPSSLNANLSYYSSYDGITNDMPSWVSDRPSSVSVDYQSSTTAPFGTDRLMQAWDDAPGWEVLEVHEYKVNSMDTTIYSAPIERGMIEILIPYMLPMAAGVFILLSSGIRVLLLEFDQQQSKIQRRLNIGSPLSRYDWNNVDFQNFALDEHSFTVTHHHSGDEHTSSSTSYSHHSGLNLTCSYEGGTHVLFFIEDKNNRTRLDLIENLFKALGLESPLEQQSTFNSVASQASSMNEIRPPLVSQMPADSSEEMPSMDRPEANEEMPLDGPETSEKQPPSGFWDQV